MPTRTFALLCLLCLLTLSIGVSFARNRNRKSSPQPTTIQGCLTKATSEYFLTSSSPDQRQYRLLGDTAPLSIHVGHIIEVRGSITIPAVSTYGESAVSGERSGGFQAVGAMEGRDTGTIQMDEFRDLSTQCSDW